MTRRKFLFDFGIADVQPIVPDAARTSVSFENNIFQTICCR
jgi:hypothetical protein